MEEHGILAVGQLEKGKQQKSIVGDKILIVWNTLTFIWQISGTLSSRQRILDDFYLALMSWGVCDFSFRYKLSANGSSIPAPEAGIEAEVIYHGASSQDASTLSLSGPGGYRCPPEFSTLSSFSVWVRQFLLSDCQTQRDLSQAFSQTSSHISGDRDMEQLLRNLSEPGQDQHFSGYQTEQAALVTSAENHF